MKIPPIVSELNTPAEFRYILVLSGQHHDENLSSAFFHDMGKPEPDINLQVRSGTHAWQTAEVMKRFEAVLNEHKPELVGVAGDVNSAVAAALAAKQVQNQAGSNGRRSGIATPPSES